MPNNNPIFIGTPRITTAVTATASNRDGTRTLTQLFVADITNGSRLERISAFNVGTQSVGMSASQVRVFITDRNGDSPRLFREQLFPTLTPGPTVLGSSAIFNFPGGLLMGTNSAIYVGQGTYQTINDTTHWTAEGGDF